MVITEEKTYDRYGINQQCLEGPTGGYVQFKRELDRKHCRLLVGILMRHINSQLHKVERGKSSNRKCGAEEETPVHVLRECPALEKKRKEVLGGAQMDLGQIKEVGLCSIVPYGKRARMLTCFYNSK